MSIFSSKARVTRQVCLIVASLLCLAMSAPAFAQQYARPTSTVTTGNFLPDGAATLHEALDEVTANTSDYITSANTNEEAHLGLGGVIDPNTSSSHVMRARAYGNRLAGQTVQLRLYENSGGSLIATHSITIVGKRSWEDFSYTLSGAEADSITDYTDLSIRITNTTSGNKELWVSWFELEVPDPVAASAPIVTSPTFTNVTSTTATLGGNVTDDGGSTVTSRGVEWGTSSGS
jgi:hypothetical protein